MGDGRRQENHQWSLIQQSTSLIKHEKYLKFFRPGVSAVTPHPWTFKSEYLMKYVQKESFPIVSSIGHGPEESLPCARLLTGMPWHFKQLEKGPGRGRVGGGSWLSIVIVTGRLETSRSELEPEPP